uniref:Uncharacterized protein n=1 Tax=Peronospora matthiolae TaxID=2874970 RepID=A0AAV1UHC1_9STRA
MRQRTRHLKIKKFCQTCVFTSESQGGTGFFDAVTAYITVQAEEKQSRVEVDKSVQVIARIAARTLQVAAREEEAQGRDAGLLSQFVKKLLLTPSAVTCPLTSYVTMTALSIKTILAMQHFEWRDFFGHV